MSDNFHCSGLPTLSEYSSINQYDNSCLSGLVGGGVDGGRSATVGICAAGDSINYSNAMSDLDNPDADPFSCLDLQE